MTVDGYPYGPATINTANGNTTWNYLLNTTQLADGAHTFGVTVTANDGTFSVASATFQVANFTSPSPTTISIDTPNTSSTAFKGTAFFGGWAVNPSSAVTSVDVAVDGVPLGTAQYGSDRSDACAAVGALPGCPNIGWNIGVDTTYFANGAHALAVTATTAAGQSYTTTSSFTVAN